MKNIIKITALVLLSFGLTSMFLKEPNFHMQFEQHGKTVEIMNGEVTLDKSEFDIVFEFDEPMGVLVNSSFEETTYMLAAKGKKMSLLPSFDGSGMAEGLLNTNKETFISDNSPCYWYYDNATENRFNKVEKKDNKIICKRTIQNLYTIQTKKNLKIEEVNNPLYIVSISYNFIPNTYKNQEIKREFVKINWK